MFELVKREYDKRAETYDDQFEKNFFRIYDAVTWKYLEPYLPTSKDAVVLDAGGGTGRWSIPIARKGLNVTLVDISEGMLSVARRKVKESDLEEKIALKQGDIAELEYLDETFDLVFCEHALFLTEEPAQAVRELARVLKTRCPLIISCPNTYTGLLMCLKHRGIDTATEWLDGIYAFIRDETGGIKGRGMTPLEFRKILQDSALNIERIAGKVVTMLGWPETLVGRTEMPQDVFQRLLEMEMRLCEREDALGLAAHLQAIAYKK